MAPASVERDLIWMQRDCEGERRAFARFALDPYLATMQLDELAREREAQAGPLLLSRVIVPDLPELLEHRCLIFRRDADAGVADGDHGVRVLFPRRNIDVPAIGGEFDRIRQQVQQN